MQPNELNPEQQAKQQKELLLNYLQTVLKPSDAKLQALIKRVRSQERSDEAA